MEIGKWRLGDDQALDEEATGRGRIVGEDKDVALVDWIEPMDHDGSHM